MTSILAQCKDEKCATIFFHPFPISAQGQNKATLVVNNRARKETETENEGEKRTRLFEQAYKFACPKCGGEATWPDGTYELDFTGNGKVAKLVDGPEKTKQLVQQVDFLIQLIQKGAPTKETVINEVAKVSPALADISRKTASSSDYAAWVAIVIALLTLFKDIHLGYFKKEDKAPVNQEFVDYLLKENEEMKKSQVINSSVSAVGKAELIPKRNDPCPCGSGIKFKKCHGFK